MLTRQRKTLDHNNLIAEVTAQLSSRFAPAPNMIKARIEALIDREYLERDESNMKVYTYLVRSEYVLLTVGIKRRYQVSFLGENQSLFTYKSLQ